MTDLAMPLSVVRRPVGLWWALACLLLALAWDATGWDLPLMHALGDASGFALRHQWWLERVLHDAMRHLATGLFLALWLMVLFPMGPWRGLTRGQRLEIALGATWGLLAVNAIKRNSLTSCPWELQDFGGAASYVSHWMWGVSDGGGGHCFPGGHASAAMALLAVPWPWLASPQAAMRRFGHGLLWGIVLAGLVLGLTQTVRGAHFPSHTLWTLAICGVAAVLNHHLCRLLSKGWSRRLRS